MAKTSYNMQASLEHLRGIVKAFEIKQYINPVEFYADGQIKVIQEVQDEEFWDRAVANSTKSLRKWYIGSLDYLWP